MIGLLMGLDNALGIFVQPWMGNRSDRTRTRWGRRIPFIVARTPPAAGLFLALPFTTSFPALLVVMFLYALVANCYRPISEALMPDFVAAEHRSKANALIRLAAALTVVVSSLVSVLLVDRDRKAAFVVPAALMLLAVLVLALTVRENLSPAYQDAVADPAPQQTRASGALRAVLQELILDRNRSRLWMLLTIFLATGAWSASRTLMTPYGSEVLGRTKGEAGGINLPGGIAFILAAFPVALLAGGPRHPLGLDTVRRRPASRRHRAHPTGTGTAVVLGAIGYTALAVNAVVVLWDLAPSAKVLGTYTALFGVGDATGWTLGPALVGALVDVGGRPSFYLDTALVAALALFAPSQVSRKHPGTTPKLDTQARNTAERTDVA